MSVRFIDRGAIFGGIADEWRYALLRRWALERPVLRVVGCNPSTAGISRDDATVRVLASFAAAWGFGGFELMNLFGAVCTDSRRLHLHADPTGPETLGHMFDLFEGWGPFKKVARRSGEPYEYAPWALAAWGDAGVRVSGYETRVRLVLASASFHRLELRALGTTRLGGPFHPLRKSLALEPVTYLGAGLSWVMP